MNYLRDSRFQGVAQFELAPSFAASFWDHWWNNRKETWVLNPITYEQIRFDFYMTYLAGDEL